MPFIKMRYVLVEERDWLYRFSVETWLVLQDVKRITVPAMFDTDSEWI